MPREAEDYRPMLAELKERYPCEFCKVAEIARREQIDPRTVRRIYGIPRGVPGIDIFQLARAKCRLTAK